MSRIIACKRCRREGTRLFLKGQRCETVKCSLERKKAAPGMHGRRRGKMSEYGRQLREKQKLKEFYGVSEKQFRGYYDKSEKAKGNTGDNLLKMFETRLDNIVFLMDFAASRRQARQKVAHGHILVNGKKTDIPSRLLKVNDVVSLREKYHSEDVEVRKGDLPWMEVEEKKFTGKIVNLPTRDDISVAIQEQLVIEFCSK